MNIGQFRRIIDEVSGYTCAVSLYYLGDPLMHPDLEAICRTARDGGLNVHVSSNFSFSLSDGKIRSLLTSGITHLTVCVDGLTQENYARTRIGGRIDRVLDNLERVTKFRTEMELTYPHIEVQYIKFRHNKHEIKDALTIFQTLRVEQVTTFWGAVHNYTDLDPGKYRVFDPLPGGFFPRCWWPYMSMLIRYDGDVIPCCWHRLGEQYIEGGDKRSIGSVFKDGVAAVWNSPAYRRTRRLVASPQAAAMRGEADGHFCEACPRLYKTDQRWRSGRDYEAPLIAVNAAGS